MTPVAGDGMEVLLEAMITGDASAAIENQEVWGQQLLVADETLPRKYGFNTTLEQLESMGIVFGENADDLFVRVRLPEGWSKQPTSHSMWSNLIDDQGRTRAMIFYKAAFYDRDAHIDIVRRFSYQVQPVCGYSDPDYRQSEWHVVVTDCDEVVWQSDERVEPEPGFPRGDKKNRQAWLDWGNRKDALGGIAKAWLNEHWPEWENPLAYWGDDNFNVIAVIEEKPLPWYRRLWLWVVSIATNSRLNIDCDQSNEDVEMKRTYLIQRLCEPYENPIDNPFAFGGEFKNGGLSDGAMDLLRPILRFDYMGAAEFEFGAVPEALSEIHDNAKHYQVSQILVTTKAGNRHAVYAIAREEWQEKIDRILQAIAEDEWNSGYRFQESVRLTEAIDDPGRWNYRGWLELNNGYFFFIDEEMAQAVAELFEIEWAKEN